MNLNMLLASFSTLTALLINEGARFSIFLFGQEPRSFSFPYHLSMRHDYSTKALS